MSITFSNTVYPAGFVGEDDGLPAATISLDTVSTGPITITGTVTKVGDPVTVVSGTLPGGTGTGSTLYVTQYDNSSPGQILFSNYNSAPGQTAPTNPFRFVFSNTALGTGRANAVTFTSDPALVNGTTGDAYTPACYVTGTRVLAIRDGVEGEIAVEDLRAGDLAVTASGAHRSVRWVGRRAYSGVFANRNPHLLPVRFTAGSLGDNVPSRDLMVSPKHAMVLDGMLVPAENLVNGTTVTKVMRVESLEYFHIELDSHDVLIAEGAESESYVEDNNRDMFHNAGEYREAYPETDTREAAYCLPRLEDGFALEAIRQRLLDRAATLAERHGISAAA